MTPTIERAALWLDRQISDMVFGEAAIRVTIHDGEVRQIERTVSEKIRPEN